MKKLFFTAICIISVSILSAQVGINTSTPNPDAVLDVVSTSRGILTPRVALSATTSPSPLTAHVAGMVVYNTTTTADVVPALYYNDGTKWVKSGGGGIVVTPAMNVTYQTVSYTALPTDDIILYTSNTVGVTLTLPTTGVTVGKKIYVSNNGSQNVELTPDPRELQNQFLSPATGMTLLYTGDATSPWSVIVGF